MIPMKFESCTYEQMIGNVQEETKRQLQPFLAAQIVPDSIFVENESTDGMLFTEESTGHIRGTKDGKAGEATVDRELCRRMSIGNMASYPQTAGYYKAEIQACKDAIKAAGFSADTVRYGLRSHSQYVQWGGGVVHGPSRTSETEMPNSVPANIFTQTLS